MARDAMADGARESRRAPAPICPCRRASAAPASGPAGLQRAGRRGSVRAPSSEGPPLVPGGRLAPPRPSALLARPALQAAAARWLAPLILGLLFVAANTGYVLLDDGPKFTDHQLMALWSWRERLWPATGPSLLGQAGMLRLPRDLPYPPLVYVLGLPGAHAAGPEQVAARLSLAPFWMVWAVAMHGIGWHLGGAGPGRGSARAGLAVGALAICSPFLLQYAREYFLDMPQAAMQALALWLLLRTEGFVHRGRAVAFGLALGLAMLTKWSTALFMAVPLALAVAQVLVRTGSSGMRGGARAGGAAALVAASAAETGCRGGRA